MTDEATDVAGLASQKKGHGAMVRVVHKALTTLVLLTFLSVLAAPTVASASATVGKAARGPRAHATVHSQLAAHTHALPTTNEAATAASADPTNLQYFGGPVQHDPTFYAIFWLPSGYNYEAGIINGDSGYEGLMNRYLQDAGSTNIANVVSQYYDVTNGFANNIAPGTQFGGSWVDTNSYPHSGSASDPLFGGDITNAVNQALAANPSWQDGVNSTFFVFTGYGVNSCMDTSKSSCTGEIPSTNGYCAYHGNFTDSRSNTAVYANMPEDEFFNVQNFLGNGEACFSTNALPNGDIFADNEFSALSHELWEAVTDPIPDSAWFDPNAQMEIGDKCVGQYGIQPYFGPSNTDVNPNGAVGNDHLYYTQEEWSNVDNSCAGSVSPATGYSEVHGPFAETAGDSNPPTFNFAQTTNIPSVNILFTPNPSIDWGDGTSSDANVAFFGSCAGLITRCTQSSFLGSHTYAYDPTATYPRAYTATVKYYQGFAISYTQSVNIVVFAPPDHDLGITNVPANMTVDATSPAGAVVNYTTPTATDEDSPATAGASCNLPSGSTFPIGTTTVTCTASDADDSNSPVSASFTVTVRDNDLALTGVPSNVTVNAASPAGTTVTYTAPTAADEDGTAGVSCNPASGSTFPIGTTTVTCTATDADDLNSPVSASFTVTVLDNDLGLTGMPSNITVNAASPAGTTVTYTDPTAVDEDSPATAGVSCSPASGFTFPIGTTTVTCTATDADDLNSPVSASFTVTVLDNDLALSGVPANINVDATSPAGATVTYTPPTAVDEDSPPPTPICIPASGSTFAIGDTTVLCSVMSDDLNGTVTAQFNVHVEGAAQQLQDLQIAVVGVGPGTSLVDKVTLAEQDLAAGDTQGTCGALSGFIHEVRAQSGKSIPTAEASALIAAARQIQAVIGTC